jgi:Ca2+/Na+ antiporter
VRPETDRLALSASIVGAPVVTSLPELVTTLAAVRRGALQLAVGGIIGGNTFDTLFLTISDVGYRPDLDAMTGTPPAARRFLTKFRILRSNRVGATGVLSPGRRPQRVLRSEGK